MSCPLCLICLTAQAFLALLFLVLPVIINDRTTALCFLLHRITSSSRSQTRVWCKFLSYLYHKVPHLTHDSKLLSVTNYSRLPVSKEALACKPTNMHYFTKLASWLLLVPRMIWPLKEINLLSSLAILGKLLPFFLLASAYMSATSEGWRSELSNAQLSDWREGNTVSMVWVNCQHTHRVWPHTDKEVIPSSGLVSSSCNSHSKCWWPKTSHWHAPSDDANQWHFQEILQSNPQSWGDCVLVLQQIIASTGSTTHFSDLLWQYFTKWRSIYQHTFEWHSILDSGTGSLGFGRRRSPTSLSQELSSHPA